MARTSFTPPANVSLSIPIGTSIPVGSTTFFPTGIANQSFIGYNDNLWGNRIISDSIWNKDFGMLVPGQSSTLATVGTLSPVTNGTLSTPVSESLGTVANFLSSTTFGFAGCEFNNARFFRGTQNGYNGFFMLAKFAITGNSIGEFANPSGSRIFIGMSRSAASNILAVNAITQDSIGLQFIWATGGSSADRYYQNWMIMGTSGANFETTGQTPMAFNTGVYQFALYCPPYPNNQTIYWELDDLLGNSGCTGYFTGNLPLGNQALKPICAINVVSGTKNFTMHTLYAQSSR